MLLQLLCDRIHVGLDLAVFRLHLVHFVGALLEDAEKALVLFVHIEVFELSHEGGDHTADFTQVFGPDALQSFLGKIRHLFLGADTVGHDCLCIGDIDLFCEIIHHPDLFGAENCLFRFFLLRLGRRCSLHCRCCLRFRFSKRQGRCSRDLKACKRICRLSSCRHFCSLCSDFVCHISLL